MQVFNALKEKTRKPLNAGHKIPRILSVIQTHIASLARLLLDAKIQERNAAKMFEELAMQPV